jgi:hypothetical protein
MRFRQVHLDFHTSEKIPGIGSAFSKTQFQDMLKRGEVDSITVFSKCHHGWSYHPTKAGRMHPNLKFDLLGAQIEAAHAIGVKTPVYISAGLDEQTYWRHPEWARRQASGSVPWTGSNDKAGYHELCMNTAYLEQLLAQIEEVMRTYAADGIFLDIVGPKECWCNRCVCERAEGGDPLDKKAIAIQSRRVYLKYTSTVRAVLDRYIKDMPVFHNGGHIARGDRELARANSHHLELESLPTMAQWGYEHFPLSAGYARTLGMPFLGMTGKFHTWWGEFGGYKHPNALRYETAAVAAQGGAISIGDQLHPDGAMEPATYELIGPAYREIARIEPWLRGARSRAEIALLSLQSVAADTGHGNVADEGVSKVLGEGHCWFDVVDTEADFSRYRLLILPDAIRLDAALLSRLKAFTAKGGRILATGASGLARDQDDQLLDFGARDGGVAAFSPDYIVPHFPVPPWQTAAFVVYGAGRVLQKTTGEVLAHRDPPFFNRELSHFCSHQHTPNSRTDGGPAIVAGKDGTWICYDAFKIYHDKGQQVLRDIVLHCIRRELGGTQIESNLPSGARCTLMRQDADKRDVLHLLYATLSKRGGIEVIEDLVPLAGIEIAVRRAAKPSKVVLAPSGEALPFTWSDGRARFTVARVHCHQMVALED